MEKVALEKVCKIRNGYAFKSQDYRGEGIPLLRISNFDDGDVYINDKTVFVEEKYLDEKADFKVEKGDVLIALSGATTGKYGVYNFDYPSLLNQRIGLLKSDLSKELSSNYFFYYLNILKKEILLKAGGAAQPNISTKSIGELKIPLPSIEIQKKIGSILDEANTYRQKTKEIIDNYEELTQSLFLDMFGNPVSNPKKWNKEPMSNLMTIVRGGSPRPIKNFLGGTYPWIKIGDGTKGSDIYLERTKQHITKEGLNKTRLLPQGSLIFANCGVSLGFARIITFEGCIHDGWLAFTDLQEDKLSKVFLLKALNSITRYFRETAPDGTQPNLNTSIMNKFEIILPPIELQKKFEKGLLAIEEQKKQAEQSLKKSEELFNSLLQKAFKGELKIPKSL